MTKLQNHFHYFWWAYIIIVLAVIFLWTSVFGQLAQPQKHETLSITFFGDNFDNDLLQQNLQSNLPNYTAQEIKKYKTTTVPTGHNMFGQLVQTNAQSADILIFEESLFQQKSYQNYFNQLPADKLQSLLGDVSLNFYTIDGKIYGIILDKQTNFGRFYSGEKQCILFFSPYSANLASLFDLGETKNDCAIQTLRYLMEQPNGQN